MKLLMRLSRRAQACSLLAALLLCSLAPPALAQWRSNLPDARLVGSGDYTWFGFSVYTARLWSPSPVVDFSQPFVLELTYKRDISRETLVEASLDEMRRVADIDPLTLSRWGNDLRLAFADVVAGQRIAGEYLPGRGGRFYLDGRLRHEIADPQFARAFFAIWLGADTRSPRLRQALLGPNTELRP